MLFPLGRIEFVARIVFAALPTIGSQYLFIGQTYYHWLTGGDCLCYSQQLYLKYERAATGDARL